jgi:hypothetical protein
MRQIENGKIEHLCDERAAMIGDAVGADFAD